MTTFRSKLVVVKAMITTSLKTLANHAGITKLRDFWEGHFRKNPSHLKANHFDFSILTTQITLGYMIEAR